MPQLPAVAAGAFAQPPMAQSKSLPQEPPAAARTRQVPAWQRAGLATRFAPDGQAVEEQDILGIPSTVKLGYAGQGYTGGVLPYLTAKNAAFGDVLFESCETGERR